VTQGAWLGITVLGIIIGGVLSALFQSLRDLSRISLEEIAAVRNKRSRTRQIDKILEDVEGHASAVALPRILANLVAAVAGVFWVSALQGRTAPTHVDALIGVLVTTAMLWVFGMLIPQGVARHAGEAAVYSWAPLIRLIYVVMGPFKLLADFFDELVRRLTGKERTTGTEEVQDEILSVVEEAEQEGQLDEAERKMFEGIVRFRDLRVVQIMTPRTEIEALEVTNNLGEVTSYVRKCGHSRVPVYEENLDHIVGVFYVKDLMRWLAGERSGTAKGFELKAILRPALFVPESKTVRELMHELLAKKVHIAIVADEFGGTAGLVTIEDIMEEIVGEIQDEYEKPDDAIPEVKLDEAARAALIDARAYITDVNAAIRSLGVELPESEEYDTVGGFVTVSLGRIPAAGEEFREGGIMVRVLEAEPTRVTSVRIEVLTPAEEAEEVAAEEAAADAASGASEETASSVIEGPQSKADEQAAARGSD
jgi:putative hemolysin